MFVSLAILGVECRERTVKIVLSFLKDALVATVKIFAICFLLYSFPILLVFWVLIVFGGLFLNAVCGFFGFRPLKFLSPLASDWDDGLSQGENSASSIDWDEGDGWNEGNRGDYDDYFLDSTHYYYLRERD